MASRRGVIAIHVQIYFAACKHVCMHTYHPPMAIHCSLPHLPSCTTFYSIDGTSREGGMSPSFLPSPTNRPEALAVDGFGRRRRPIICVDQPLNWRPAPAPTISSIPIFDGAIPTLCPPPPCNPGPYCLSCLAQ